jgi:hypothetical protein
MLSKLSIFSRGGGRTHADDVVERGALTSNIVKALRSQFDFLTADQISSWTCERRRSDRSDVREEIKIFDSAGNIIYLGRAFNPRTISFWTP